MTTTIENKRRKLMAINGMPDHVHLLIGLSPNMRLSDLVQEVKAASSALINSKRWIRGPFNWQRGFGAFSYSRSQVPTVARYIENQQVHHKRQSFRDEYTSLLKKFSVDHDVRYLFEFLEPE